MLAVQLNRLQLANPILVASGTFGYAREMEAFVDFHRLGKKGIIERRDELLDLIVNDSQKVIAILTGDEHNYCRTEIGPETEIYDKDWDGKELKLSRTIYQINNGAAGAPYYAQEETPWTPFTSSFTTQNALVFFHVDGKKIRMEVLNPDTLEVVDELDLR